MLDQLSLYSDEMTELLLGEQTVPEDLIRKTLREATLGSMIVPVLCGSALDGIGVQPVLDAVADYLPSPADVRRSKASTRRRRTPSSAASPTPPSPSAGWSSRSRPTATATCTTSASIPAC